MNENNYIILKVFFVIVLFLKESQVLTCEIISKTWTQRHLPSFQYELNYVDLYCIFDAHTHTHKHTQHTTYNIHPNQVLIFVARCKFEKQMNEKKTDLPVATIWKAVIAGSRGWNSNF